MKDIYDRQGSNDSLWRKNTFEIRALYGITVYLNNA